MLHILPLFGRAIFKSLWFEQEAIIKVFLGKVTFAEKNDSSCWEDQRSLALPHRQEQGLDHVVWAQPPRAARPSRCSLLGCLWLTESAGHGSSCFL